MPARYGESKNGKNNYFLDLLLFSLLDLRKKCISLLSNF